MTASTNGSIPPQPKQPREAAELYLRRGFRPIPLPPRTKKCKLDGWPDLRIALDALDAHFPEGVECNIGLLLGEPSGGLVDVDLDSAEALAAAPFFLPPTGWVSGRKSNPRSHHWYTVDDSPALAAETFKDADGAMLVELRSTGGQTMVGPSLHPCGERVGWYSFDEPAHVAVADLRRAVALVGAAALLAKHWPARGSRHAARLALAGGLLRGGLGEDLVADFLTAVCTAAGNEDVADCSAVVHSTARKLAEGKNVGGWPTLASLLSSPARDVIDQVRRWLGVKGQADAKKPLRPPEPFRPFPTEHLPQPLRAFVEQAAVAIGCDASFVALPAMAAAASLIGNTRSVRIKRGWTEPCILWTCIIGESGTLKSPAIHAPAGPVYRLQEELRNKFKADLAEYEQAKAVYADKKKKAKQEGAEFTEEPPGPPIQQRVVVSDITVEKIAQVLEDNPRGTLLLRDELAAWFGSFTRYKGKQGGSDVPNWLEMHRAGCLIVDRKTGDRTSIFVPRASVCVAGGIQPGTLARCLTAENLDAGLGARILPSWPPRQPKVWREDEIAPEVCEAYESLLRGLADLTFPENGRKEREPFALRMTPAAKALWVDYYNDWAKRQAAVEGATAAAYAKLEGGAARLALLHHVVSRVGALADDNDPIEPENMAAGVALARWFAYESGRIYAALGESEDAKQARRLIDFIRQRGGRLTGRRLHQSNKTRYPSAEDAEAALQTLVDAGLAEWSDAAPGPKGGRPTRVLILKPHATYSESYETTDDGEDDDEDRDVGDATEPATKPPSPCGSPAENDGFVANGACSTDSAPPTRRGTGAVGCERGDGTAEGVSEHGPKGPHPQEDDGMGPRSTASTAYSESYETGPRPVRQVGDGVFLVTDSTGLELVRAAIEETAVVVGADTETTGLDPRTDRVRLLTLDCDTITDGQRCTYLIDAFRVDVRPLFKALADRPLVMHNGLFDLGFLGALGFAPGHVHDTMLLSQMLDGTRRPKGHHGLAQVAEREQAGTLDKSGQKSDWSGELTAEQLAYAAKDAAVLPHLYVSLSAKAKAAGLSHVADIEGRCLPAVAWMAQSGVGFDRTAWDALAQEAARQTEALAQRLDAEAPARPGSLMREGAWNWSSPEQVKEAFAALGVKLESTDDDALAAVHHPLAGLVREYRSAGKLASTYGPGWYADALHDDRVYAAWKQIGADSGRMACASPNLQNLPRDSRYRRCFVAPPGRILVKADYSQIELRIAAKLTGEKAMLDGYGRGEDLHTQTARLVLGVREVTKPQRQLAKAVNFGLLYGMGAKGFRVYAQSNYGVVLTEEEAVQYREAFFAAYPGLRRWHRSMSDGPVDTRTRANRRRAGVTRFTEKLNTPIQGTGADGLKVALALLWERRGECPGAFPVLAVHDEIVVECDAEKADAAKAWLTRCMIDGMAPLIAPVSVEVEATVGRTWAGD